MSNLIIVPIYPPHFPWAKNLLDSASNEENIALGFSNQTDANSFKHSFPFKPIISNIQEGQDGFISKKKLDLLQQVQNDYDYISIIDAECKFLQPTTPFLGEIWNNNCFLANHSTDGSRIMRTIIEGCGYKSNDDLYCWFNDIPVYKTDLLPGFFQWLENKKDAIAICGGFDFLLFAVYCRYELGMSWRILNGYAFHGLVENADEWKKAHNKHLMNEVSWSTYRKDIADYPNIKMLFHLDRYPIL